MAKQPRKPRFMISIDDSSSELLKNLQAYTGLSPAQAMQKILPSHLEQLHYYLVWLRQLPKDTSLKSTLGPQLLRSYGVNLIARIKEIDPLYAPK